MAKKLQHVWGLEIGQSSLKGLRCHLEGDEVIADAFDFVEYPKILSQPEAETEALIADALAQFTSRNDLRGAKVGVSVPGQSGLAKFFKPPPVEVKKIADIVKYEARQQIPFDLKDVIWDYQQMEGSQIEDGYALESEVGLFAMKREAVFRAVKPYRDKGIDIDLVQLAPMSLYNMITFDRFLERLSTETYNPEAPQKSLVILSIGTDASDLIVTNGFRVWQRNIPIGGNHFTRQLTKDLKLTFAKAEHLKRNALQADDPKLIFQAMRPVFNDMVTEIQRSLNFYKSVNKKGDVESMLLLGNTSKLPGLLQYLNKNLGIDVAALDKFPRLEGTEVIGAQAFKENVPAFGVVYGLCLQMLKKGPMQTSLLPRDLVIDRVIRNKKPWTVGALSILLASMVAYHASRGQAFSVVDSRLWSKAESAVDTMSKQSSNEVAQDGKLTAELKKFREVGKEVSSGASRRVQTLEVLKAIEQSMFKNPADADKTPIELPYKDRKDFHIEKLDQKYFADLSTWFSEDLKTRYKEGVKVRRTFFDPAKVSQEVPDPTPLAGPGWVFEIKAYHYHNDHKGEEGPEHVLRYMVEFLENGMIEIPITDRTGLSKPPEPDPSNTAADAGAGNDSVSAVEGDLAAIDAAAGVQSPAKPKVVVPEGFVTCRDLGIRLPVIRTSTLPDLKAKIVNPEWIKAFQEQLPKTGTPGGSLEGGMTGGSSMMSGGSGSMMPGGGSMMPGGGSMMPGGGPLLGGGTGGFPGLGGPGSTGSTGFGGLSGDSGGGLGSLGSMNASNRPVLKDEKGNVIPYEFEAPIYNFTLQFAWKPRFETEGGTAAGGVLPEGDGAADGTSTSP